MLILTFKTGSKLFIDEGRIIVEFLEIELDYIKISIDVPLSELLTVNVQKTDTISIDGGRIKITPLGMAKVGLVRLGVNADKSISIHRESVWNKIQAERAQNENNVRIEQSRDSKTHSSFFTKWWSNRE